MWIGSDEFLCRYLVAGRSWTAQARGSLFSLWWIDEFFDCLLPQMVEVCRRLGRDKGFKHEYKIQGIPDYDDEEVDLSTGMYQNVNAQDGKSMPVMTPWVLEVIGRSTADNIARAVHKHGDALRELFDEEDGRNSLFDQMPDPYMIGSDDKPVYPNDAPPMNKLKRTFTLVKDEAQKERLLGRVQSRMRSAPVLLTGSERYKVFEKIRNDPEFRECLALGAREALFISPDWVRQTLSDTWEDMKIKLNDFEVEGETFSDELWEHIMGLRKQIYEERPRRAKKW